MVVAVGLSWLLSISLEDYLLFDPAGIAWGIFTAFPLLLVFLAVEHLPLEPIQNIQKTVLETMGNYLAECNWLELLLLASLAGIGEELLFRGFLMNWLEGIGGYWFGLLLSSLLFGLMHAVTWVYTLFAGLAGLFFGWLFDVTGERNLIPPILCHSLYDFLAFLIIVRDVHQERGQRPANSDF